MQDPPIRLREDAVIAAVACTSDQLDRARRLTRSWAEPTGRGQLGAGIVEEMVRLQRRFSRERSTASKSSVASKRPRTAASRWAGCRSVED